MEKQKILWVDDDIDVALSSFIDELKEAGYQVLRAPTPDMAWQQLEENSVSVIIMDVLLPPGKIIDPIASRGGMVGLRLLEKIQKEPKYANIPAVIFTILGKKDKEVNNWALKNGIKVLSKLEIYPEDLLEAINELLGKKKESKP